ncbi:MAG: hypothetical protein IT327_32055 [Anaerolineae bacterium]|nr:hypothetical protein [Anaerolineae bacterium]
MARKGRKASIVFYVSVIVIIIGQVTIVVAIFRSNTDLLEKVGWFTGAVLPALGLLYNLVKQRSLQVFLWSNRLKNFFSVSPTNWTMSVNIKSESINESTLDSIVEKLKTTMVKPTITSLDSYTRVIESKSTPMLKIEYYPLRTGGITEWGDSEIPSIFVTIQNYKVGHRVAAHAIKQEISHSIEQIGSVIANADSQYNLTVEFQDNKNPFFGLFISQLPQESISRFAIQLNINSYGVKNRVSISESRLDIASKSQLAFSDLASEFLTFGSGLEEYLQIG